jgi:tetratricopeptide (TPR) repeat protein
VVAEALEALADLRARDAADRALDLVSAPSWEVRRAALRALARMGGGFDLARLRPVLAGDDLLLRHEAWQTLRSALGPDRWQELQELTVEKALREPAQEHFLEASRLAAAGRHDEAARLVRRALRMSKRPEYHALLGEIHLEQRSYRLAIRSLQRALAGGDDADPVTCCKLAMAHYLARDLARAQACFRQVLRLPGCPEPVRELAEKSIERIREKLER